MYGAFRILERIRNPFRLLSQRENPSARKYALANAQIHDHEKDIQFFSAFKANGSLMELALENLAKPENQQYALNMARQGPDAIRNELKLLDIENEMFLDGKIQPDTFFRRSRLADENDLERASLPVETGEFAKEHGSHTHALQLFAMTYGMTKKQKHDFIFGNYLGFFNSPATQWAAWDMVFDAPGDFGPNSPLWWRLQLERNKISVTLSR